VVGIAEDAVQQQLVGEDRFRYYMPMAQFRPERGNYFIARVRGDPAIVGESIRKALQPVMPGQAYVTTRPFRELVSGQQRSWRFGATMFVAFGVLALIVAAVGLYGVIGYDVAQRMHELGVRTALGAQARDLMRLVLGRGVQVAIIGIIFGTAVAFAASSKIQPLLFQQSARDPGVLAIVAGVLLLAAIAACIAPARRAATADPNVALRSE
jgi:ABC-type antimicrobial peptide transport system permease subunit